MHIGSTQGKKAPGEHAEHILPCNGSRDTGRRLPCAAYVAGGEFDVGLLY